MEASPKIVKGSGSSAMQLAVWKAMDYFASTATSPVWLSYRPIGSGGAARTRRVHQCQCLGASSARRSLTIRGQQHEKAREQSLAES